jgi:hypothetical protein
MSASKTTPEPAPTPWPKAKGPLKPVEWPSHLDEDTWGRDEDTGAKSPPKKRGPKSEQ